MGSDRYSDHTEAPTCRRQREMADGECPAIQAAGRAKPFVTAKDTEKCQPEIVGEYGIEANRGPIMQPPPTCRNAPPAGR